MAWMRNPYRDYWRRTEDVRPTAIATDDAGAVEDLPDFEDLVDEDEDDEGGTDA